MLKRKPVAARTVLFVYALPVIYEFMVSDMFNIEVLHETYISLFKIQMQSLNQNAWALSVGLFASKSFLICCHTSPKLVKQ